MAETPTAARNLPLKHVRAILAKCPGYQTLIGGDEAAALLTIHYYEAPSGLRTGRPWAVIGHGEGDRSGSRERADSISVEDAVDVTIEDNADEADTDADKLTKFINATDFWDTEFVGQSLLYGFRLLGVAEIDPPGLDWDDLPHATESDSAKGTYCYRTERVRFADYMA